MSSTTTESDEIRYGNLRPPKLPGFFGIGAIPSAALVLGALIMMVLIFTVNLWTGLVTMGVVALVVLPEAIKTKDGEGHYSRWLAGRRHRRSVKKQTNVLAQGMAGIVPGGECHPPGVAASVKLHSARDVHGREFGLIEWTSTDLYAVVINVYPAGRSGIDKGVYDRQIAQFAAWLAQLNHIGDVVGAAVVVESAPDSGERLRRAIDRGRDPKAAEFAVRMAEQLKESSRAGAPIVTTRVTVTFKARQQNEMNRKETWVRSREEMAAAIGDVLPTLTSTLDGTGAGQQSQPATAQEITDAVRVAYDPSVAPIVEEARFANGTGLTWDEAGPTTAVNLFDRYQHDGALSRTWQMREAPKGLYFSNICDGLLAPHRDITRKRVAIVYRPEDPSRSAQIAEHDVTAARFVASQNQRAKMAHQIAVAAAEKTAQQEAMGSPLIRVGILVTVTVLDADSKHLDNASAVVLKALAPHARIKLRLPRGTQDSAFVAALPLGMVPYYHAGISAFADGM